ncbi:MAG: sulfatase, partial [Planctomycetes bacterium]|nr:sulfatase [Planctomycetota bacterium]
MPFRKHLIPALALLLAALRPYAEALAAPPAKPNVVLILADDLGWADLGCYGNAFNETPHIDRLAQQGVRFTQFYAGPVCSPTRANLQSGRDQARFGITQHIPGHRRPFARLIDPVVASHLPLEVETFAERLRTAGYATGYFGKWHLGGTGYSPQQQGWDTVLECKGNTLPPKLTGGTGTRRTAEFLTEKAIAFIETHRERPFLLQVSHFAVHIPLSTTPELLAKYRAKKPVPGYPCLPEYAGLLEELDRSVGRLVAAVDELGLTERTLILFLSDNGGLEHQQNGAVVTSNAPLRGEKGTLYEGGLRVPAIARWSGVTRAGTTCDMPVSTMDVYPTLLELAGVSPIANQQPDGVSLAGLLKNPEAALGRDTLYWHLPHYHHSTPAGAIRRGDWKLIEFFEDGRLELYNLRNDPAEQDNLAGR